jgi:hypothetical protein
MREQQAADQRRPRSHFVNHRRVSFLVEPIDATRRPCARRQSRRCPR